VHAYNKVIKNICNKLLIKNKTTKNDNELSETSILVDQAY